MFAPVRNVHAFNRIALQTFNVWEDLRLSTRMLLIDTRFALPRFSKRVLDVMAASFLLMLTSPLLLLIALLVKLDGGPVFYSQARVGRNGRLFAFWKFRSMVVNADQLKASLETQNQMAGGVLFKMKRDPRVTTVGRLLRRLSLDELPQLWNVLKGDMTLVGPRPALPKEVMAYDSRACRRLEVQQGITCLWQVKGRNLIPFHGQVSLDLEYAQSQNLVTDFKILLATLPAVISGKGAY